MITALPAQAVRAAQRAVLPTRLANDMVSFCQAFSSVLIESSACEEKLMQLIACIPTRTYECSGSSSVAFPVQPDPCAQLEAAFVVSNEPSQAGECIDASEGIIELSEELSSIWSLASTRHRSRRYLKHARAGARKWQALPQLRKRA